MNRTMLKKQETTLYKNDTRRHIFNYPGVYQALIMACIAADGITLFSLIDLFLKQSQLMSFVITFAVAGVLNIAAVLLAACLHNEEFTPQVRKGLAALIVAVFLLFFSAVFSLRVASMEYMYGSNSNDLGITVQNIGDEVPDYEEEGKGFEPTLGQIILAVILGLEPLGTSVLCFCIGYEQSPERKRRYLLDKHKIDDEEVIDHNRVMVEELTADMAFDLDAYDEEQMKNMAAVIIQYGELAKETAIRKLAEHDATPEGVSYLMEGGYLKQHRKENESTDSTYISRETSEVTNHKIKSIA